MSKAIFKIENYVHGITCIVTKHVSRYNYMTDVHK